MNKTIKLVMISLLVSVNMLAQKTDNIQQQYGRGLQWIRKNLQLREER